MTPKSDCGHCDRIDAIIVTAEGRDHANTLLVKVSAWLCSECAKRITDAVTGHIAREVPDDEAPNPEPQDF